MRAEPCPDCGAVMQYETSKDDRVRGWTRCPWANTPPIAEKERGAVYPCGKPHDHDCIWTQSTRSKAA